MSLYFKELHPKKVILSTKEFAAGVNHRCLNCWFSDLSCFIMQVQGVRGYCTHKNKGHKGSTVFVYCPIINVPVTILICLNMIDEMLNLLSSFQYLVQDVKFIINFFDALFTFLTNVENILVLFGTHNRIRELNFLSEIIQNKKYRGLLNMDERDYKKNKILNIHIIIVITFSLTKVFILYFAKSYHYSSIFIMLKLAYFHYIDFLFMDAIIDKLTILESIYANAGKSFNCHIERLRRMKGFRNEDNLLNNIKLVGELYTDMKKWFIYASFI
ncbi:hypothetical protein HHI36_013014 [Cryptolaemus montrouzieri]|uniref:Gustatory receptor n=1 Tax=Cryptolaemus montrouzieri TaxID=559131 RepID=A0ABD2NFW8_9CUCU